jgi:predicted PurR-regulated permease PerM
MRRPLESWIALLAVTAVALYVCWLLVEPFVTVLLWAGVLAIVSYPYYLRNRARGRGPSGAAAVTTLLVVLVVIIPVSLVALALVRQTGPAAEALHGSVRALLDPDSRLFALLDRYFDVEQLRDPTFLGERLQGITAVVARRTLGLVGGVIGAVVQMAFVLFTLYYLLRDADRIVLALRDALPLERAEADEVFRRTRDAINASLYGTLVIAAIQGTLGGLAFAVLGLPSPLLWGVVMFLLSLIPMAGSFVVWVPAALYLALTGQWVKAVLLTVWGGGVIGTLDNFLRPRLVGERARLHELIVFFSVLGGLHLFGVLGLVIGPVVVTVTLSLVDVLRRVHRHRIEAPPAVAVVPAAEVNLAPDALHPRAVAPTVPVTPEATPVAGEAK